MVKVREPVMPENASGLIALSVIVKNPSDFIGSALGESEKNTKDILAATAGKVLVIDEVCVTILQKSAQQILTRATIFRLICCMEVFLEEEETRMTHTKIPSSTPS